MNINIEDRISISNVAAIFYLSQLFYSPTVSKQALQLIESCFQLLADHNSFLELDYKCVAKILLSSKLNIHSELEVFNFVVRWLSYLEERSKYSMKLLCKVRLSLLSVSALKHVKSRYLCFIDELALLENMITEKITRPKSISLRPTTRYCPHHNFKIAIFGGEDIIKREVVRDVYSISPRDLKQVKRLPGMNEGRSRCKAVCVKNEVYVLGGRDGGLGSNWLNPVSKYSSITGVWQTVAGMRDERADFCACSFMGDIFVFGGNVNSNVEGYWYGTPVEINSCVKFNTTDCTWKEVAKMREAKDDASCSVFEGKLVVSGGFADYQEGIKTVEAYDHVANTWTYMPDLVDGRYQHRSCAMKNKLYIISGSAHSLEVYSSYCNKFELLKPPKNSLNCICGIADGAVLVGNKIVLLFGGSKRCLIYNVETADWSEESVQLLENIYYVSTVKLPQY